MSSERTGLIGQRLAPSEGAAEYEDWPLLYETLARFEERDILPADVFRNLADELKGTAGRLAKVYNTRFTAEIYEELFKALREGKTVRDFADDAQKILDKYGAAEGLQVYTGDRFSPSYADTVFRTNTQAAQAAGHYAEMFHPDWMEAEPYWQFSAIDDSRTRPEHAALDGKVFRKDDPEARKYLPPIGFNCLPASALVSGRFSGAFKTWYTGPMIEVTTRRGNRLTVTANHPVLTPSGFVRADGLKEGDYLLCNTGRIEDGIDPDRGQVSLARVLWASEGVLLSDDDHVQHGPTEIGQLFETFKLVGSGFLAPCRSDDFYGDAVFGDGKVEVVLLDRKLSGRHDSTAGQSLENLGLPFVDEPKPLESGPRLLGLNVKRNFAASDGGPRGGALAGHGFRVVLEPAPLEGLGLTSIAEGDAEIAKSEGQNGAVDPGRPTELQDGFPREIPGREAGHVGDAGSLGPVADLGEFTPRQPLDPVSVEDCLGAGLANAEPLCQSVDPTSSQVGVDQVVFAKRFWFSGHVYDLQSPYGWILAQNIYISNCRCQAIPLTDEDVQRDGLKVASGAGIQGLPLKDADGNPILGKDGQPQTVGRPPKGWDADRVESLVPGTLKGGRLEEPAGGGGRRRDRFDVPETTGPASPVPPLPPKLEQKLVEIEGKSIDLKDHEHGAVVSQDGKVLWEKDGPKHYPPRRPDTPEESDWKRKHNEADRFELPISQKDLPLFKDAILTHNHPSGYSLSVADLLVAVTADAQRVRAVARTATGDLVFELDRGDGWPPTDKVQEVVRRVTAEMNAAWAAKFNAVNHLPPEEAEKRLEALWQDYNHELLDRISGELQITYGRRQWSP